MGLHEGKTSYNLLKPFRFGHGKEHVLCTFIELYEPTQQHSSDYFKLRQMIKKAEMDIGLVASKFLGKSSEELISIAGEAVKPATEIDEAEHENIAAKDMENILTALEQSDRVDLDKFIDIFVKMITKNSDKSIVRLNGNIPIMQGHISKFNPDDLLNMACWWCSFFVTPSAGGQKTISEQPSDFQLKQESTTT